MRFDLESVTDTACHAVFDPAAMLHRINDASVAPLDEHALDEDVAEGKVLLFHSGGDGGLLFRVFVDEAPDANVMVHATNERRDLLLRLPSGTLFACGCEYLFRPDEPPIAASAFASATYALGEGQSVPAGEYRVQALEIERPRRRRTRLDSLVGLTQCWGCGITAAVTALLFVLWIGLTAVAAITALVSDRVLLAEWGRWWLLWAAVAGGYWLLIAVVTCLAGLRPSVREHKRRLAESFAALPFEVVLVLESLPSDVAPSGLQGASVYLEHCRAHWEQT